MPYGYAFMVFISNTYDDNILVGGGGPKTPGLVSESIDLMAVRLAITAAWPIDLKKIEQVYLHALSESIRN